MTDPSIPTFQFSSKRLQDIPFQIIRFEELPDVATQPSPRRRAFYEIFWITKGAGKHHVDFEAWTIVPNTLYFITPGQVSFWELREKAEGFAILFTQDFMATNLLEQITLQSFDFYHHTNRQPFISIKQDDAVNFTAICEHMHDEYNGKSYGRFTLLQCQLITLLVLAQRHYSDLLQRTDTSIGDKLVAQYLQLLDEYFDTVQNVSEYAGMLGITAGHLRDTTRNLLGVSPNQLLNNRITLEAKRLLVHSEQSIAEVASRLNFEDPSYFSRFFKRQTNETPSAFRAKYHEKYHNPRA